MHDDRVSGLFGLLGTGRGTALDTVQGVFAGILQGSFGSTDTLDAYAC
ncbi:hypothetical protein GCM10025791_42230 [Halioxenophilus aromaticivorans]|uniref:Uncharacterized protein n=1 Tax=Halioxenophilus aromaticivorans TaxID=1306992 RepID=A0AAV3U897_9ALTE